MGIAVGDFNRDCRLDLFVTTFSDDNKTLYRNEGDSAFTDVSFRSGLGTPTIPFLSWGAGFLDFDNDALLDLFIANGHVYPIADNTEWGTTYGQRPLLFRNVDGKNFAEVPSATGSGLASIHSSRGAAFGDLFNDGHIDVVLNNIDAGPTILRNAVSNGNHWLELKLIGSSEKAASEKPSTPSAFRSSRDAIGAKVFLTNGAIRQRADVVSGGSYASSSDPRIHFGLGSAAQVDRLEIVWPDGVRQEVPTPAVDQIITAVEQPILDPKH
jgi:enediyne biosynthesis protein E4